jgi:hypothetical protein
VEDYIASGKLINIDHLCPDRRQSYETGDHELLPICYVCVDSNDDRELMAEYEKIYRRVTKSGSHGTFDDVMTESKAIPAMKYLHSYLAQNRNIFNTCLGLLPGDTFCESTSGPPPSRQARRRSGVRAGEEKGGSGRNNTRGDGGSNGGEDAACVYASIMS